MLAAPPTDAPLRVACLCADWCKVCREWQPVYAQLAAELPQLDWIWVDVEEQADALGDFDPDNFPLLAVQHGADLLYCAALPPHAGTWRRVIEQLLGEATPLAAGTGPDLRRLRDTGLR